MYKLVLIGRYFQHKPVALFALLAVALCTAMVVIVISVMGGFLDLMMRTAKNLSGDVVIQRDLTGFAHYEQMLEELRQLPQVDSAAALVRGFGLIKIHGVVRGVSITGIRPDEFNSVTNYRKTLHWTSRHYLDYWNQMLELYGSDLKTAIDQRRRWYAEHELRQNTMEFATPFADPALPGIVPGIAVSPANRRDQKGQYQLWEQSTGSTAVLTVLPISPTGGTQPPAVQQFTVANEFKSGFMELDMNFVYVPFDLLQEMLDMGAAEELDQTNASPTGRMWPTRATKIIIRGSAGYSLNKIEDAVSAYVDAFSDRMGLERPLFVSNWLEGRFGTILAAVRKEKLMMGFLFGIISLVAVVMVAVIFYMIVMDKTRDIGLLRAVGTSRGGIIAVFLGYSLLVGMVGAALGLALAAGVVWNLNEIQDLLAHSLGVIVLAAGTAVVCGALGALVGALIRRHHQRPGLRATVGGLLGAAIGTAAVFAGLQINDEWASSLNQTIGFTMWNPEIYYFDRIPSRLDSVEVAIIVVLAVAASVLGALVPAWLAGLSDPVTCLRYE